MDIASISDSVQIGFSGELDPLWHRQLLSSLSGEYAVVWAGSAEGLLSQCHVHQFSCFLFKSPRPGSRHSSIRT